MEQAFNGQINAELWSASSAMNKIKETDLDARKLEALDEELERRK